MRSKSFNVLLAILLVVSIAVVLPTIDAVAKPVGPNPGTSWPSGTIWGTGLRLENGAYIGDAWFGAKTGSEVKAPSPPPPTNYMAPVFIGTEYFMWVKSEVTAPQSYSWYVKLGRGGAAPANGTLSCELENATHEFIPPDFSVVLENSAQGIHVNLRAENGYITGLPKYATLYVDNAVNIENFENTTPLTGNVGDNVSFSFDVVNTGRYADNYTLSVNAGGWSSSVSPTILELGLDGSGNATVNVALGAGNQEISVEADGAYAWDNSLALTATGTIPIGVDVSISPAENSALPGENVTFEITVKNTSSGIDNYNLTASDTLGWTLALENNTLYNIAPGDNKQTILKVTIPESAVPCTEDNVTITATSQENVEVSDNASCIAHAVSQIIRGVEVSISPSSQENQSGGELKYTVRIANTGSVADNYDLSITDNAGWNPTLDNENFYNVGPDENRTTTLRVTIPDDATGGTRDNVTVTATSVENENVSDNASCIAHVTIVRGVEVSISPEEDSAEPYNWLEYTVCVVNTGNVPDTYNLSVSDELGWDNIQLVDNILWVDGFDNENMTVLRVHIPWCTEGDTEDIITVTATSQSDNTVSADDNCTARVAVVRDVEIEIEPKIRGNVPCENVTFTITVVNMGNVADNFDLSWVDTENWGDNISLVDNILWVQRCGGENTTTLRVHIPENAELGTEDNITVIATSRTISGVKDNDSCIARAAIVRRVDVSISPSYDNGLPSQTLGYTVKVTNEGSVVDNYDLTVSDNAGWGPSLSENLLENVSPGENRAVTLIVTIPENAEPDTEDNIIVTATSYENTEISDNANCIARSIAITRGVEVSISPNEKEGMPGSGINYTIRVTNTGNIADNYDLIAIDNLGWDLSLADNSLEEVAPGENRTTTLTVVIYENAEPDTEDDIIVTATSQENAAVSNSASCLARALILRRVGVSISPGYRNGLPGATLNYTVRVTNTGWAADNYRLVTSGTAGWAVSIDPNSLALEPGESGEAVLSVTVPPDVEGSSMIFYVWAISSVDPTIRAHATCRALALETGGEAELSIPWIQIVIIAAVIAGSVFAAGYLTRERGRRRPKRRMVTPRRGGGRRRRVLRK